MDIIRSVINRMDIWNVALLAFCGIVVLAIVGGFWTVADNRDAHTKVQTSIIDGCKGSDDFAKCVGAASSAAGVNTTEKDMQQYIIDKCFANNTGSAQNQCVNQVSQSIK